MCVCMVDWVYADAGRNSPLPLLQIQDLMEEPQFFVRVECLVGTWIPLQDLGENCSPVIFKCIYTLLQTWDSCLIFSYTGIWPNLPLYIINWSTPSTL